MKQFDITLRTFEDVQEFVEIATVQPFRIVLCNGRTLVNAKSFMGVFSLDFKKPVHVRADCTEEQYRAFQEAAAKFLA